MKTFMVTHTRTRIETFVSEVTAPSEAAARASIESGATYPFATHPVNVEHDRAVVTVDELTAESPDYTDLDDVAYAAI